MPTISVNGLQMYYELHGAGQPLALIEGLGTDLSDWSTIIEPLAQSHQVIAFDIRGAGRTDKPDEPYTIEQMADDTAGLLDALGIAQSKYPQPRYAYERQRAASTHYDCTDRLPQIHAPTLILHGRSDKIAPIALAKELHTGILGSRLELFHGGHLFLLFGERQRFLDAVTAFLSV